MSEPNPHPEPVLEQPQHDFNALTQLIAPIQHSLDFDHVVKASVDGICSFVNSDWGCLLLWDSRTLRVELHTPRDLPPALHPALIQLTRTIPSDPGVSTNENSETILAAIQRPLSEQLRAQGFASYAFLPLLAPQGTQGLLLVAAHPPKVLALPGADLLRFIGVQVGTALEHARLYATLTESEKWYRAFIEQSPDGFVEGDMDGRITYVNAAMCQLLEVDRDAILGQPAQVFANADETRAEAVTHLMQHGYLTDRQTQIRLPNGKIKTLYFSHWLVRDSRGQAIRFQSIARDVTQQQHNLDVLHRRTQELAALNAIATILSNPLEIAHKLDQVCEQIATITGMETTVLHLLDESGSFLNLLAHRGVSEKLLPQIHRLGLDDNVTHQVAGEGHAFAINDVAVYIGNSFAGPRADGYHAGIGVPIQRLGKIVGAIFVGSRTKTQYEKSDVDLLVNIGNQIAVALENQELYAQMAQRVKELDGLAQLSAACANALDVKSIAQAATKWLREFAAFDFCSVRILENNTLRYLAGFLDTDLPPREFYELDEVWQQISQRRAPFVIANLETDTSLPKIHREYFRQVSIHSLLIAPLPARDRIIGMIGVGYREPYAWTSKQIDLIQIVANQIGVALNNAELYAQAQQRVHDLDGLAQLSAACTSALDVKRVAEAAVKWVREFDAFDLCVIRAQEGDRHRLLAGFANTDLPPQEFVETHPIWQQIAERRSPFVIENIETAGYIPADRRARFNAINIRSLLIVPLSARDLVIGMLIVGYQQPHRWNSNQIELIVTVANQVAVALNNAELYAQAQQRVAELDGLAQLSAAFVTTLDPKAISALAVEWTRKLIPAHVCTVRLLKDRALHLYAGYTQLANQLETELAMDDLLWAQLQNRAVYAITNRDDPQIPETHRQILRRLDTRSSLLVSLPASDRVLGFISVAYQEPHKWSTHEIGLLQTIANQTANALDNALLFQRVVSEQRKVQAIFDSGLSGLFATDAEGNIIMFNRAAERITGWTLEQVRGRKWVEILSSHPDGDSPTEPLIAEALRHKRSAYVPSGRFIRTRDGRVIPAAKAVAPLLDEKENVIGAVGAFWDLSKEQLVELAHENFLIQVAHQLRTPLTTLLSALELFEHRKLPGAQRAELWELIKRQGGQLKLFADQFLDRQAAVRSSLPLQFDVVSVATLARQIAKEFQARRSKPQFRIQCARPEPLAYADRQRVENVLRNLFDNAVTHAPAGSRVDVAIKPSNTEWIQVTVQDQGPGIPREDHERIFTPFYRAESSKNRRTYGHGLGLAIAKEMVTAMEGEIWVTNRNKHGAIFHFTLRRAR